MVVRHFQLLGRKTTQEDAFYISDDNRMIVVCDGVGGHTSGELASNEIIRSIKMQYEASCSKNEPLDLSELVSQATSSLNNTASKDPQFVGSSTTLAILFFKEDNSSNIAHIGDSRVILLREKSRNYWATKDHSIVQELYDAGVLKTEDQMRTHPYKNRITRAITAGKEISNDLTIQELHRMEEGDCFIVCSDGLLENYTNSELQLLFNLSLIHI